MALAQFKDAFYFYYQLFCVHKNAKVGVPHFIDLKTFSLLVEIFDSYGGVNCKTQVPLRKVISNIQDRMGVLECINELIYANSLSKIKTAAHSEIKSQQLVRTLQMFNLVKKVLSTHTTKGEGKAKNIDVKLVAIKLREMQ